MTSYVCMYVSFRTYVYIFVISYMTFYQSFTFFYIKTQALLYRNGM